MDEKLKKIYEHWIEMSDKDAITMDNLYKSGDYHWSLFVGHLVLEKLLKGAIIKETGKIAPFSHDLSRLSEITSFPFSDEYLDWLDTITTFNLNARYNNYKQDFYKKSTSEFANSWLDNIKILRLWIKEKLKE